MLFNLLRGRRGADVCHQHVLKRKKIQIIVSANYHNVVSAVLLWYVRRKTVVAEAITRKLSDQQSFVLDKQKTDTECRLCSFTLIFYRIVASLQLFSMKELRHVSKIVSPIYPTQFSP